MRFVRFFSLLIFVMLSINCSKDEVNDDSATVLSSEKDIISFEIANVLTNIDQISNKISLTVPANIVNYNFSTAITVSSGATLNTPLNSTIDYGNPVTFIVRAQDGSTKQYLTELSFQSGLQSLSIKSSRPDFSFYPVYDGSINNETNSINFLINKDIIQSDVLTTKIEALNYTSDCTSNQSVGDVVEVNNPQSLVLTKNDGSNITYSLNIKNTQNKLIYFKFPTLSFSTDFITLIARPASGSSYLGSQLLSGLESSDFIVRTLETENISNVVPEIFSPSVNANVNPNPLLSQNFNQDVSYTITSESGILKNYKIRVIKEKLIIAGEGSGIYNVTNTNGSSYIRYLATSKIASLKMINESSLQEVLLPILSNYKLNNTDEYYLVYSLNSNILAGNYKFIATLENGEVVNTYYQIVKY